MPGTHWRLDNFIEKNRLPIYITNISAGTHPEYQYHDHYTSEIVLICSGEALHIVDTGKEILQSRVCTGDLLVIHPGVMHCYADTATMELCNVVYDRKQLAMPMLDAWSLPLFTLFFPGGNAQSPEDAVKPVIRLKISEIRFLQPFFEELFTAVNTPGPGTLFATLAAFMRLTLEIAKLRPAVERRGNSYQYRIGQALYLMAREYHRPLTLDQLARAANMSRRNFSRNFRLMTGESSQQYLLHLRLRRAVELLENPNHDLAAIALACGFCDSNYFCKQFRKIYHISPGEYRKKMMFSP